MMTARRSSRSPPRPLQGDGDGGVPPRLEALFDQLNAAGVRGSLLRPCETLASAAVTSTYLSIPATSSDQGGCHSARLHAGRGRRQDLHAADYDPASDRV